jgi:hypothetical protein
VIIRYGVEWLTADELAEQVGSDVTPDVLCDWKRRGLIRGTVLGSGQSRAAHYRLDDTIEAEFLTRTQTRGRPRAMVA